MKKQLFTVKMFLIIGLIGSSMLLSSYSYKKIQKNSISNQEKTQTRTNNKKTKISPFVGAWVLYFKDAYAPNGKGYFGFVLEEDGSAASIMSYAFRFKRWKVKGNKIIFMIDKENIDPGFRTSSFSMIKVAYNIETINDSILNIKESPGQPSLKLGHHFGMFKKDESKRYPIVNVKNGQKITSPLYAEIENIVYWPVFEGEMGTITLVDKNNKKLGIVKMTSTDGHLFKAKLTFDNKKEKSGKLIFRSNKRKDIISKSFEIPVTF